MAVGEIVEGKFTWLLDDVELVGTVAIIEPDNLQIEPAPNYTHLISYSRGNNPLLWSRSDTPGRMHCETYPLEPGSIDRDEPWPLEQKPESLPFALVRRDGTTRSVQVGDIVRVVGRWVIDHHPEYCSLPEQSDPPEPSRCRSRGWLRIGPTHMEMHPFRWDTIQLVEPLRAGDPASAVLSLASPLHEEQYLGNGKWVANELAGVAGKVFIEDNSPENNFHTIVRARVDLDPPPRPDNPDPLLRCVYTESILRIGEGMPPERVRSIEQRSDGGITVRAFIDGNALLGRPPSIHDPANDRLIFQARYELRWGRRAGNAAEFVEQSVPTRMEAGNRYPVRITMRNVGTTQWSNSEAYRLGSQSPQDNGTWGLGRVDVPRTTAPGDACTFEFEVVAPPDSGPYDFQWRMLRELVEWFGAFTPRLRVDVIPRAGRAIVPDVREELRNLAAQEVRAAGLVPDFNGPSSADAWVASQRPSGGVEVDAGSTVQMFLRRGPIP